MDRYKMNPTFQRPYQSTCGMQCQTPYGRSMERSFEQPVSCKSDRPIKKETCEMPMRKSLAMAYVPTQAFGKTFDLCHALQVGTIFPELCKPFCGKRGMRRC